MFSSKTFQWHVCAGYLASKNGIPQAHTYFSFIALKGKKQKKKGSLGHLTMVAKSCTQNFPRILLHFLSDAQKERCPIVCLSEGFQC